MRFQKKNMILKLMMKHGQVKRQAFILAKEFTDTITDNGRSFSGYCQFNATINKNNKGIRTRVRTDNTNFQCVKVFIDGTEVTEKPWIISKNNYEALWIDSDFEVPVQY